jgi:hypothetical protein
MDVFSIATGVVGVIGPTLQCVRLLVDDLQKISNAPDTVKALTRNLKSMDLALASIEAITDTQWISLGEAVAAQSHDAITTCKDSCERFKTSLSSWTRHSADETLSWRDRIILGIFRENQIKSMSKQLHHCSITLTSVASIATL